MAETDRRAPGTAPKVIDPPKTHIRREVIHRMTLATLAVLLVSISLWCLLLLFRSMALRQDLSLHQDSIADLRGMRAVLERPTSDVFDQQDWPELESRWISSQHLVEHGNGEIQGAAKRLSSGLEQLQRALFYDTANVEPAAKERVLDASFTVLKGLSSLESRVHEQITDIYGRLDDHWRSQSFLVILCMVLCASNLGLLHLAHRRRAQLESARDRAVELSSHDALTGLWNRDAILKMVRREIARAQRRGAPLGLILTDVDKFQEVNGLVGQEQGDVILQEVAWRLGSLVRPYDTMGRLGGDSFLVVLPSCDSVATANVTERLSRSINDREVEYGLGRMKLTLSFVHLTVEQPEEAGLDLVLHRLQEGLVELKESGRRGATLGVSGAPRAAGVKAD